MVKNSLVAKLAGYGKADLFFKFTLLVTFATLPLSKSINTFAIMLLILAWVLRKDFMNYHRLLNYKTLLFIGLYFLYMVGMLYTDDKPTGWQQLEQKLSLLGFPVIFSTTPRLSGRFVNTLLMTFVASCTAASLICLAKAAWLNYSLNALAVLDVKLFTSQNLAYGLKMHATYFSIFMVFSIYILVNRLMTGRLPVLSKVLLSALSLYLLGFTLLLSARIVILSFVLIAAVALPAFFLKGKIGFKWLALCFFVFLAFAALIFQSSYFKKRFGQIYNFNTSELIGSAKENGITQRIFLWRHAKEIIKQHPVIGVGTGDVNAALDEQYKNLLESNKDFAPSVVRAIKSFSLHKFNAHNQFLQTTMAIGLLGLIVFLVNIGISTTHAYREKQYLFLSFLALFVLSCLSESLLERQWGIVFFSFLNSLFLFNSTSFSAD